MNPSRVPDLQNLTKQVGDLTEAFSAVALTGDFWDKLRGLRESLGLDGNRDPRLQHYVQSVESQEFKRMLSNSLSAVIQDWKKLESIRVMSVGCGRLREAFAVHAALRDVPYSELSHGLKLWGVEIDPEISADTSRLYKEVAGIEVLHGDGSKLNELKSLPEKFELIYFRHQNISDRDSNWMGMFEAALERLAPGGRLLITSFSAGEHRLALQCLDSLGAVKEVSHQNRQGRLLRKASRQEGAAQLRVDGYIAVYSSKKSSL